MFPMRGKNSDRIRSGEVQAEVHPGRVDQRGQKVERKHTKSGETDGHMQGDKKRGGKK